MRKKILTASAVLAVVLFAGCGGSDKSTRSMETTTLGDSVGLSTKSIEENYIDVELLDDWYTWGSPKGYIKDNLIVVNGDGSWHSGLYNNTPIDMTKDTKVSFTISQPLKGNNPHSYIYAGLISNKFSSNGSDAHGMDLGYVFVDGGHGNYGEKEIHGIRVEGESVALNSGKPINYSIEYKHLEDKKVNVIYTVDVNGSNPITKSIVKDINMTTGYVSFEGRGNSSYITNLKVQSKVSIKNTLQTGTSFTISKDIQKDAVIGKVESDKLAGEILSFSLCGDYANYFSIDENGTLKLECDLPEDFEDATLKVEAELKKDGVCKNISLDVKISVQKFDLTKGLVAYYKFDGDAKDSSGNGNDGIENGTVTYLDGVTNQAASFDGHSDILLKSFLSSDVEKGLTFSFWMNRKDTTTNSRAIISQYTWYNDGHIYGIMTTPSTIYSTYYMDTVGTKSVSTHAPIQDNTWEHIVVNLKIDSLEIWKNGNLESNVSKDMWSYTSNSNIQTYIGNSGIMGDGSDRHYEGMLDNFRVYNRALSAGEIKKLYKIKQ